MISLLFIRQTGATGNGTNAAALLIAGDLSVTNGGTVNFYSNNGTYTNDPALPIGTKLEVGGLARVATNSTLFFRSDGLAGGSGLFRAGSVTVDAGGMISANGQGFNGGSSTAAWGRHGFGPGGGIWGSNTGGGGGYGGKGGNGNGLGATGGNTYGHAYSNAPAQPGSGGASPNNGSGGSGGGAIRMEVAKTLTVNGTITANGNPYVAADSGAGSGGSVWIATRRFSGGANSLVSANGGNAHLTTGKGGSGGGGRVAVWRTHHDFAGTVTAAPGAAGAGFPGVEGSVVLIPVPAAGTLGRSLTRCQRRKRLTRRCSSAPGSISRRTCTRKTASTWLASRPAYIERFAIFAIGERSVTGCGIEALKQDRRVLEIAMRLETQHARVGDGAVDKLAHVFRRRILHRLNP